MLGKGAQSVIRKGTWQGKPCAFKKLTDMDYVLEASLLVTISHENIISAYGIDGMVPGGLRIALELADCDLTQYIKDINPSEEERLDIFNSLLCAVSYLHKNGIYHGDIKANNCLMLNGKLKLADFGAAKVKGGRSKLTTPSVSSPQVLDKKDLDHAKSDIWALGVTFYYILTGKNLFHADSMHEFRKLIQTFLTDPRAYLSAREIKEEHIETLLLMLQEREEDRVMPTFMERHIYPPLFQKRILDIPEVPSLLEKILSQTKADEKIRHNTILLFNSLSEEMQTESYALACYSLCHRLKEPYKKHYIIRGEYYTTLWRSYEERIILYKQGAIFSQLPF